MPSPARGWLALLLALSIIPIRGVFTLSRIFFIRDLSFFFWSRHLWLRHTLFAGEAPWWDPHVAAGQSAIADALNQLVMPITLAIRLLPTDIVSFNLWVALPLPVAAVGMFAFLRQRVEPPAAALGAAIFTLAGPTVSMLNTPNLSWSVAFIPWVMWAMDREAARRVPVIAITFGLQALCGEPVTWVGTGLLAGAWVIFREGPSRLKAGATYNIVSALAALAAGGCLAAMQLVPTLLAGMRAHRAAIATPDFWSLHPVALWEGIAPNVFGNYYDAFLADLPWMSALNFARDPFFYSLYVGPLVLLLAVAGLAARPRRNAMWAVIAVVAIVASLGGYTPLYPLLRKLVPALMYFRFPVKYIVFAVFALSVLAAEGWRKDVPWLPAAAGTVALAGLTLTLLAFVTPDVALRASHWLAISTHLKDPSAGAAFLARTAPPLAARAFALLLAGVLLLLLLRGPRARVAAALFFVAICADLAVTNAPLNMTMEVGRLAPPAWYRESAGSQRLYIGGRMRGYMNSADPDGVGTWQIPAEATAVEGRMELNAQLPMAPSGWRVREALSYDLPYLWPAEYEATLRRFEQAGSEERAAFLRRSGVRRCVLPETEPRQFRVVADVPDWNMRVFECNAGASRVYLASSSALASNESDLGWQREALFDTSLRDDAVRLARAPRLAGTPSTPAPPSVQLVEDGANRVTIAATLRDEGIVVLRDSFDRSWSATVDGDPADVVRANGRYRAVAVPAGRHVIRFSYRPKDFIAGLIVSVMTGVVLLWLAMTRTASR